MTKHERIFLVFADMGLGGVQTKMLDIANTLAVQGVDCWVLLNQRGVYSRISLLDARVRVLVFSDYPFAGRRPFRRFRFTMWVTLMIFLWRPSSIFVSLCTLASQIIVYLSRCCPWMARHVVVNEDTFPSLEQGYADPIWGRWRIARLYPKVKGVIAVSKDTYRDLHNVFRVPAPPLVYLPNWTSFEGSHPPDDDMRTIDLVYGGRLDAQKRPELLMDFFQQLLMRLPRLVVRIYGDGELSDVVDQRIKPLQSTFDVRREPPTGDFSRILRRSKIFIFTSLYEGLPFVGIEAMKYGAVIVGLHAPGVSDLVVRGRTGILASTIADLVTQTRTLLKSSEKMHDLRRLAYERARKHFSEKNRDALIRILLE